MTQAAARLLPVAAILAAGTVASVWYAGEGTRGAPPGTAPPSAVPATAPATRAAPEVPPPRAASESAPARDVPAPRDAAAEAPRPAERAGPAAAGREPAPAPRRAEAPRHEPPRFDVVRVGLRGNAVVAGRASPGAEVVLFDGLRELGRARADARGEWVILPADPVGGGAREFSLRARMPGGEEVAGTDTVLVVGPALVAEAAQPAAEASLPLGPWTAGNARPEDRASDPAPRSGEAVSEAGGPSHVPNAAREPRADPMAGPARREAETATAAAAQAARQAVQQPATAARAAEGTAVLLLPPTSRGGARPLSPGAGSQNLVLGLDVVDYDDGNTMRFTGSAPPGAQVRVYADERHLGDAQADAAGRWTLAPDPAPTVGRHTLRVDQLAAGDTASPVASRIEVPFQREALPAAFVRDGRVVVQPGNNLWRIAREAYGRGTRYTVIYRANQSQIRNPSRIYPGQVFAVPAVAEEPAR